jgi:hypothetical protein
MITQPALFDLPAVDTDDQLYVIVPDAFPTLIKIGTTSRSLARRARELHGRVVWSAPGGRIQEHALHQRFQDARLVGTEYFVLTPELARYFGLHLRRSSA